MRIYFLLIYLFLQVFSLQAQNKKRDNVIIAWHPNLETYFIAERLAVQHIGNYVFTWKDSAYPHQPLVTEAYKEFKKYTNTPSVVRISQLLYSLREILHDNAEIIQYLLYRNTFPQKGEKYPFRDTTIFHTAEHPEAFALVRELADSLRTFYIQAGVSRFLRKNEFYYRGALNEFRKDVNVDVFRVMEEFYGEKFYGYAMYIMPLMPITYGEDNYRAFGPMLHFPGGRVSTMVVSSSRMLPVKSTLRDNKSFGYDNPAVTKFLTVHEMSHSFVNPHIFSMEKEVLRDSALFTPSFSKLLEKSYISNWEICVIEHLVRLGEIRIALARNDIKEAERLRKMHVDEFHFILLPLLEEKISMYESHRDQYPDFKSFLPVLLGLFHSMKPEQVDQLVANAKI